MSALLSRMWCKLSGHNLVVSHNWTDTVVACSRCGHVDSSVRRNRSVDEVTPRVLRRSRDTSAEFVPVPHYSPNTQLHQAPAPTDSLMMGATFAALDSSTPPAHDWSGGGGESGGGGASGSWDSPSCDTGSSYDSGSSDSGSCGSD